MKSFEWCKFSKSSFDTCTNSAQEGTWVSGKAAGAQSSEGKRGSVKSGAREKPMRVAWKNRFVRMPLTKSLFFAVRRAFENLTSKFFGTGLWSWEQKTYIQCEKWEISKLLQDSQAFESKPSSMCPSMGCVRSIIWEPNTTRHCLRSGFHEVQMRIGRKSHFVRMSLTKSLFFAARRSFENCLKFFGTGVWD